MQKSKIKLLIADDSSVFRQILIDFFDESDDIELMQRRQWRPLVKEIASQADSAIVLSGIALCWNDKVACSE